MCLKPTTLTKEFGQTTSTPCAEADRRCEGSKEEQETEMCLVPNAPLHPWQDMIPVKHVELLKDGVHGLQQLPGGQTPIAARTASSASRRTAAHLSNNTLAQIVCLSR